MLTLVTKQDLWWPKRQEVKNFYENGAYNESIKEIRKHKGMQNFSHDYVSASLNLLNMRTHDGILLAETAKGYDKPLLLSNFNEVVKHIKRLAE